MPYAIGLSHEGRNCLEEYIGAFQMNDPVPAGVIRTRSERMRRLGEMRKTDYYAAQEGRTLRVLFEERRSDGGFVGFSDNYVKVSIGTEDDLSNHLIDVRVTGISKQAEGELYATAELEESYV